MVRVTETGIETTEGLREFDIIVWATGFDFGTGALARMGIRGRDGLELDRALGRRPHHVPWPADPRASPTSSSRVGPTPRPATTPATTATRSTSSPTCWCIARDAGDDVIEVSANSEERWTRMVDKGAARTTFGTIGQYVGSNIPGKPKRYLLNTGGRPKLFEIIGRRRRTRLRRLRVLPGIRSGPGLRLTGVVVSRRGTQRASSQSVPGRA